MLNYYELVSLMGEDMDKIQVLRDSFKDDFADIYNKIQINKATRRQALNNYRNRTDILTDKDHSYLWGTPSTLFYSNGADFGNTGKTADLSTAMTKFLKWENRHPHDEYIKDSIAVARALGWTPTDTTHRYYIECDGNTYDFNLVYSMFMMIADNNMTGGCNVSLSCMGSNRNKVMILTSKYGMVVILPFRGIAKKAFNVSMINYMKHNKDIDNMIIGHEKTA